MGLIQRILDIQGLTTISISLVRELTEMVKPSRALFVEHPFGLTMGDVGDTETHRAILMDCLRYAQMDLEDGIIIDTPYKWSKNDLRERQLRKEAH